MNLPLENDVQPAKADATPMQFRSMDRAAVPADVVPVFEPTPPDAETIAEAARQQGVQQGVQQAEAQMHHMVQQERQGVTRALEEFVREKQRYFAGLEKEVVRLSLAIAERVLHREAAMDPILLAGAARVALEEVKDDRDAILRVAADDVGAWTATMARENRTVEVRVDPALGRGECILETANGSVELGVRAQLKEIEHGFFELLGRNPALAG